MRANGLSSISNAVSNPLNCPSISMWLPGILKMITPVILLDFAFLASID